jgi:hypothetical protein
VADAGSLFTELLGHRPRNGPNFLWLPDFSVCRSHRGFSATDLQKRPTFFWRTGSSFRFSPGVLGQPQNFCPTTQGYRPDRPKPTSFLRIQAGRSATGWARRSCRSEADKADLLSFDFTGRSATGCARRPVVTFLGNRYRLVRFSQRDAPPLPACSLARTDRRVAFEKPLNSRLPPANPQSEHGLRRTRAPARKVCLYTFPSERARLGQRELWPFILQSTLTSFRLTSRPSPAGGNRAENQAAATTISVNCASSN